MSTGFDVRLSLEAIWSRLCSKKFSRFQDDGRRMPLRCHDPQPLNLEERVIDVDEVADHLRFAFVRHCVDEDVYVCGTEGCMQAGRKVDEDGVGKRTRVSFINRPQ